MQVPVLTATWEQALSAAEPMSCCAHQSRQIHNADHDHSSFNTAHLLSALSVQRQSGGGGWCDMLRAVSCTGPAACPRRLSGAVGGDPPGLPPTAAAWPMARPTAWRGVHPSD
jgi:hypothetical protein